MLSYYIDFFISSTISQFFFATSYIFKTIRHVTILLKKPISICLVVNCIQNKVIACSDFFLFVTQHLAYIIIYTTCEKERERGKVSWPFINECSSYWLFRSNDPTLFVHSSFFRSLSLSLSRFIESINQHA